MCVLCTWRISTFHFSLFHSRILSYIPFFNFSFISLMVRWAHCSGIRVLLLSRIEQTPHTYTHTFVRTSHIAHQRQQPTHTVRQRHIQTPTFWKSLLMEFLTLSYYYFLCVDTFFSFSSVGPHCLFFSFHLVAVIVVVGVCRCRRRRQSVMHERRVCEYEAAREKKI